MLILVHFTMKAPVWYLLDRVSLSAGGGHGWYRAYLIDQTIHHFGEWWLMGTHHTADWIPDAVLPMHPDMIDITNRYVREAVDGGLLALMLFIALIARCFQRVGRALRVLEDRAMGLKIAPWCLGCTLFAHCVAFISVRYFDQNVFFWYVLLGMIACGVWSNPIGQYLSTAVPIRALNVDVPC